MKKETICIRKKSCTTGSGTIVYTHIYYTLGDKEATLKYYSKLVQCGDSEIEHIAKLRIKEAQSW